MSPDQSINGTIGISVAIAAFNAATTLPAQLESLLNQESDVPFEIIIADNGSTDDTRTIATRYAKQHPQVRLLDASEERGPSFARNRAARAARGAKLLFCDADDIAGVGWLRAMGNALDNWEFVTGPRDEELLNPAWLRHIYGSTATLAAPTFAGVFPFGPSAHLGVSTALFLQIGGFDERLFAGEDLDLCMRMWHAGIELHFVPEAVIHYRNRASMHALWRQARTYGSATIVIHQRLAALGYLPQTRWRGARNWLWLIRALPTLSSRAGQVRWLVVAGMATGRFCGSVRHRWVYL